MLSSDRKEIPSVQHIVPEDEYKPPVPPHRNHIPGSRVEPQLPKRHHHHRNKSGSRMRYSAKEEEHGKLCDS